MKLQNKLAHMQGKSVLCNGTHYKLDQNGVTSVTKKEDAERLLADPNWSVYKPAKATKKAEAKKAAQKPSKPDPKGDPQEGDPAASTEPAGDPQGDPGEAGEGEPAGEPAGDPEETGQWPDPTMEMTKEYLQKMAKAYEVEGWEGMNKQPLVDAIMAKMYV